MTVTTTDDDLERLDTLAHTFSGTDEQVATLDAMPEAELWTLAGMMVDQTVWAPAVAECALHRFRERFYEWDRRSIAGVIEKWRVFLGLEALAQDGDFWR